MDENSRTAEHDDTVSKFNDETSGRVQYVEKKIKMVYGKIAALKILRLHWGGVTRPQ